MVQLARAVHGLCAGEVAGQGLVEYAIIVALTALQVIMAPVSMRQRITALFSDVGNALER